MKTYILFRIKGWVWDRLDFFFNYKVLIMIITKFRFANLNLAKTLIWWLCSEEFSSYFHRVSGECPPLPPPPPSPFPPPPSAPCLFLSFWIIKNYFKNRVKESRSEKKKPP